MSLAEKLKTLLKGKGCDPSGPSKPPISARVKILRGVWLLSLGAGRPPSPRLYPTGGPVHVVQGPPRESAASRGAGRRVQCSPAWAGCACPESQVPGAHGRPRAGQRLAFRGDASAVESQVWDQHSASGPLPPASRRPCASTGPSFPDPLRPGSRSRAVVSWRTRCAGPGQHRRPQAPAGTGPATRCSFAGALSALAGDLADTPSGGEAFANLGREVTSWGAQGPVFP